MTDRFSSSAFFLTSASIIAAIAVAGTYVSAYKQDVKVKRAEAVNDCLMTETSHRGPTDVPIPSPGYPARTTGLQKRMIWCNAFVENGGDLR